MQYEGDDPSVLTFRRFAMKQQLITWIGILSMIVLVYGMFITAGSLTQKIIFVVGAPVLFVVAAAEKRVVFMALQLVVWAGAILAFFPEVLSWPRYLIMLCAMIVAVTWIVKKRGLRYWKTDWTGVLGLSLIAVGLATQVDLFPVLFFASLAAGGILVAAAAIISISEGFRLGWIWVVLNALFVCNPIHQLWRIFVLS